MTTKKDLIIEPYPEDYDGYRFITLIRFDDENYLNLVDNVINNTIICYVLDYCAPHGISEERIIDVANFWFTHNREKYPLSIEYSKNGMSEEAAKILRQFPMDYVARVIGPLNQYKMSGTYKIRKRKRKVAKNLEVVKNTIRL